MQRALGFTSLRGRQQFGPRQIQLEELIRDVQPAILVAVKQMVATGYPEIFHLCFRPAIAIRLTWSSACSSSPSTSRKEKARAGLIPLRGRNVRNDSRTAPSSKVRWT